MNQESGIRTQESGVTGVAEYASKVFIRKIRDRHLPGKISAGIPDGLAPELFADLWTEIQAKNLGRAKLRLSQGPRVLSGSDGASPYQQRGSITPFCNP